MSINYHERREITLEIRAIKDDLRDLCLSLENCPDENVQNKFDAILQLRAEIKELREKREKA